MDSNNKPWEHQHESLTQLIKEISLGNDKLSSQLQDVENLHQADEYELNKVREEFMQLQNRADEVFNEEKTTQQRVEDIMDCLNEVLSINRRSIDETRLFGQSDKDERQRLLKYIENWGKSMDEISKEFQNDAVNYKIKNMEMELVQLENKRKSLNEEIAAANKQYEKMLAKNANLKDTVIPAEGTVRHFLNSQADDVMLPIQKRCDLMSWIIKRNKTLAEENSRIKMELEK